VTPTELGGGAANALKFTKKERREIDAAVRMFHNAARGTGSAPWTAAMDMRERIMRALGVPFDGETFYKSPTQMAVENPKFTTFNILAISALIKNGADGYSAATRTQNDVHRAFVAHHYFQAGSRNFYVYADLVRMLQDTDIPADIVTDDIRLPFEGISINFKQGLLQNRLSIMDHIYMCETVGGLPYEERISMTRRHMKLVFSTLPDSELDKMLDAASAASAQEDGGEGRKLWFFVGSDTNNDSPVGAIHLPAGVSLRGQLPSRYDEVDDADRPGFNKVGAFLINLLLYISSEKADVVHDDARVNELKEKLRKSKPHTRKKKQIAQELRRAQNNHIYLIGKSIVADDMYQYEKTASADVRKIMSRFRVRGHWRNQPCGPELSERRKVWIRPFWKGPTLAELVNKNYVVKASEEED
jgi:hypothetical protein